MSDLLTSRKPPYEQMDTYSCGSVIEEAQVCLKLLRQKDHCAVAQLYIRVFSNEKLLFGNEKQLFSNEKLPFSNE